MAKKSHDRSPDKKGFSIALPIALIADLERISKAETRSRNGQIESFLQDSVRLWRELMAEKAIKKSSVSSTLKSVPDSAKTPRKKQA